MDNQMSDSSNCVDDSYYDENENQQDQKNEKQNQGGGDDMLNYKGIYFADDQNQKF